MDPSKTRNVGKVVGCGQDLALGEEQQLSSPLSLSRFLGGRGLREASLFGGGNGNVGRGSS